VRRPGNDGPGNSRKNGGFAAVAARLPALAPVRSAAAFGPANHGPWIGLSVAKRAWIAKRNVSSLVIPPALFLFKNYNSTYSVILDESFFIAQFHDKIA